MELGSRLDSATSHFSSPAPFSGRFQLLGALLVGALVDASSQAVILNAVKDLSQSKTELRFFAFGSK